MSETPITRRRIGSLEINHCVVGEGRPVIALHGWGGSVQSFWPVAERLAPSGFQVHLLDMPGFGQSDLPPETWGVMDYMRFVTAYLDEAQIERCGVLGHSFGGRIGLVMAAEKPERVNRMVLANSAGLKTPLSIGQQTRNGLARLVRGSLETLHLEVWRERLQEVYNRRYASADYLTAGPLRETFLRVIEEDLTLFAERVQAPTILIWGDQDNDTPLWQGRRLEQLIPDAALIVFNGAGHFSYLERLNEYLRIVENFLGS